MPMLKIALAQINSTVGDFKGNYKKIITYIKKAKSQEAEIIVFPELALTGYPPEDLLLRKQFISENKRFLHLIKKECAGVVVLIGFVNEKQGNIYNSCAVVQDKKIKDVYDKIILPNYGVFDEKRYFKPGNFIPVYTFKKYRFTLTICEDIWRNQFLQLFKKKKLDFIINISASPFHLGKVIQREKILANLAKSTNSFLFYCNLIGGQDEIVFDGTSKVFSSKGKMVACLNRFSEDLNVFTFESQKMYPVKKIIVDEPEEALSALSLGINDYLKKNGFKKVILGVSGGIDSAVVLGLASLALGPENVYALIMPSCYTSKETLGDAQEVCRNFNVKYQIISIGNIFNAYLDCLKSCFKEEVCGKTEENIQARIRGNLLMAFSNKLGFLVLNTGNKSELACGYCTLYGDMVGGFGILKDVPKMLVYKLAGRINKIYKNKGIPSSIIKRAPSAELRFNQKDIDTLPDYDLLDSLLQLYVEKEKSLESITRKGFKKEVVQRIIKMVDSNEYKRRQAPVGIKITPRAFGKDRRMPITNKFR